MTEKQTGETAYATKEVPVHVALARIVGELEGIGKNQRNKEQGYNFRGIDDVLKKVHPLLAKHGVIFCPNVIEREMAEVVSKSGTRGTRTWLHVEYRIVGPQGDSLLVSSWGEGTDYADKSTNKAMTAAFKYALFQVLAISDPDDDGDKTTPEEGETRDDKQTTTRTRSRGASRVQGGAPDAVTQDTQEGAAEGVNGKVEPSGPSGPMKTKIRLMIRDLAGITDNDEMHEFVAGLLAPTFPKYGADGSLKSLDDLTKGEAHKAIDLLIAKAEERV